MHELYEVVTRDEERLLAGLRAVTTGVGVCLLVTVLVAGSVLARADATAPERAQVTASSGH
jgi:hypothetical protein